MHEDPSDTLYVFIKLQRNPPNAMRLYILTSKHLDYRAMHVLCSIQTSGL